VSLAPIIHAAFAPDGKRIAVGGLSGLYLVPVAAPMSGSPDYLATWLEAALGLELAAQNDVRVLDASSWRTRSEKLEELGGPPQ
jgi:hypothetical protein